MTEDYLTVEMMNRNARNHELRSIHEIRHEANQELLKSLAKIHTSDYTYGGIPDAEGAKVLERLSNDAKDLQRKAKRLADILKFPC